MKKEPSDILPLTFIEACYDIVTPLPISNLDKRYCMYRDKEITYMRNNGFLTLILSDDNRYIVSVRCAIGMDTTGGNEEHRKEVRQLYRIPAETNKTLLRNFINEHDISIVLYGEDTLRRYRKYKKCLITEARNLRSEIM